MYIKQDLNGVWTKVEKNKEASKNTGKKNTDSLKNRCKHLNYEDSLLEWIDTWKRDLNYEDDDKQHSYLMIEILAQCLDLYRSKKEDK